jgi:hypothetical protein
MKHDVVDDILKELEQDDNSYMFYNRDEDYDNQCFVDSNQLAIGYKRYMNYFQYKKECENVFNIKPITKNEWNKI